MSLIHFYLQKDNWKLISVQNSTSHFDGDRRKLSNDESLCWPSVATNGLKVRLQKNSGFLQSLGCTHCYWRTWNCYARFLPDSVVDKERAKNVGWVGVVNVCGKGSNRWWDIRCHITGLVFINYELLLFSDFTILSCFLLVLCYRSLKSTWREEVELYWAANIVELLIATRLRWSG